MPCSVGSRCDWPFGHSRAPAHEWFMVPRRTQNGERRLPMNSRSDIFGNLSLLSLLSPVKLLEQEIAEEAEIGSWSQCASEFWRCSLSMNRVVRPFPEIPLCYCLLL